MYILEYTYIHAYTYVCTYIHIKRLTNNTNKKQKGKYELRFACKRMRLVITDTENINANYRKYQKCEKFAVRCIQE